MDIKNIVALVVSNKFNFDTRPDETVTLQKRKELNNEKREFEGATTDIITNEFTKSQDKIAQFIQLVYDTFNTAINTYIEYKSLPARSVFFIYKGGNILRILAKDFVHELPGSASDVLYKYYGDYFKKSDADFSIYIDPALANFDVVFDDMTKLAYLLLNYLRITFMSDLPKFFDYHGYNDTVKGQILEKLLEKLNKADILEDETSQAFYGGKFLGVALDDVFVTDYKGVNKLGKSSSKRIDYLVDFNNNNKSELILYKLVPLHLSGTKEPALDEMAAKQQKLFNNRSSVEFYISANKTLRFDLSNLHMAFNLVRMKVNFSALFERDTAKKIVDLGGELIDVSIIHKDSTQLQDFIDNRDNYVRIFTYVDGSKEVSFRATSFEYLVHDLELILFQTVKYPWEDNKYSKRLKRLQFLYLLDMLATSVGTQIRPFILEIKTSVMDPVIAMIKSGTYSVSPNIISALDVLIKYATERKYHIYTLLVNFKRLMQETTHDQLDKFAEFVTILDEDLDVMLKALYEMQQFITTKGKIDSDKLYKFTQFGGII
jgi:hypothetical protein